MVVAITRLGHKNIEDALARRQQGRLRSAILSKAMGIVAEDAAPRPRRRFFWPRGKEKETGLPVRGVSRNSPLKIFP